MRPLSLAVVALLLAGGAGLLALRENEETYTITAYFTKAIGLFENSDVDILGVPVGKVTDIVPQGDRVKVVMELPTKHKVPDDAFAQIVPISVISDRYVQLAPVYKGGPYLEDGAVLDVDRTQIPAELDDVFRQLKKLLEAIEPGEKGEPGALGDLIVQLDKTLRDREDDLKGTLINAAALTDSLADAKQDLSGILVNLDGLFEQLSTRAGSLGELNSNFAVVMTALAESNQDITGTLKNLGDLTHEVGDLVRDNGDRLGGDLERAAKITSTVLKNRASVEESLTWLPVVGEGLTKAHHPPPVSASDVRDNLVAAHCKALEDVPEPVRDVLKQILGEACGETPEQTADGPIAAPIADEPLLDCDEGVRKVKKQLDRVMKVDLPDRLVEDIVKPMKKQIRRLRKQCDELGRFIDRPEDDELQELLDELLDDVPDVDPTDVPDLDELDPLGGAASGSAPAPTSRDKSAWKSFTDWMAGFVGFLGWAR
ncbi:MAG TPA: MCE family protein [Actinomycetota bacterium]|nr:MCE family protein [Actinomycetota bacterium]